MGMSERAFGYSEWREEDESASGKSVRYVATVKLLTDQRTVCWEKKTWKMHWLSSIPYNYHMLMSWIRTRQHKSMSAFRVPALPVSK
jgi:hypothetical protein